MAKPLSGLSSTGQTIHYSVGIIIRKDNKYLLIDRANPPYGFAGIAGHIDEGENETEALVREVKEESGLILKNYRLLYEEEIDWNWCSKGADLHYWYFFEGEVSGEIVKNENETKSIGWYERDEIGELPLEPVWDYWFKKLEII